MKRIIIAESAKNIPEFWESLEDMPLGPLPYGSVPGGFLLSEERRERLVTICNDQLPDSGSYQHHGMSTKKYRAKMGRRKTMRKRSA